MIGILSKKKNQIFIILVLFFIFSNFAFAEVMSSGSYQMKLDSVNFGGGRSTSASYIIQDTAGEVGTGDLEANSNQISAGYQQADVAATVVSVSPTPSTVTSSSGGRSTVSFLPNVKNFKAISLQRNILLTWEYPELGGIDFVIIIRSLQFFPADMTDGEIIFEGDAEEVFDYDVEIGKTYYYALFAIGIVLFIISFVINLTADIFLHRNNKKLSKR